MKFLKKIATVFSILILLVLIFYKFSGQIVRKPVKVNPVVHDTKIVLIEGWTNSEIGDYLQKQGILEKKIFLERLQDFNKENQIIITNPSSADLQGFIFPDTYLISNNPSSTPRAKADEIIGKALTNFNKKITPAMLQKADALNMSIYEIVTLASIIEKETGRNATTTQEKLNLQNEREMISGIFYNRLKSGMPLQSDATVNFITHGGKTQVTFVETNIDNPYNTYRFKGLPPGPICNPSLASLEAALNPTASSYFYFLHRPDTKEAVYSKTYEEHLKNKAKYLH